MARSCEPGDGPFTSAAPRPPPHDQQHQDHRARHAVTDRRQENWEQERRTGPPQREVQGDDGDPEAGGADRPARRFDEPASQDLGREAGRGQQGERHHIFGGHRTASDRRRRDFVPGELAEDDRVDRGRDAERRADDDGGQDRGWSGHPPVAPTGAVWAARSGCFGGPIESRHDGRSTRPPASACHRNPPCPRPPGSHATIERSRSALSPRANAASIR